MPETVWRVEVISGAAGGATRSAHVNLTIITEADTVEEVRQRVENLPLMEAFVRDCQKVEGPEGLMDAYASYLDKVNQ